MRATIGTTKRCPHLASSNQIPTEESTQEGHVQNRGYKCRKTVTSKGQNKTTKARETNMVKGWHQAQG